jgi:glycosyltransferase involved in cell wall biosynthesis
MSEAETLVFISDAAVPCGVEAFARGLVARLGSRGATRVLGKWRGLWRALRASRGIVLNFPLVAWKRQLAAPVLVALLARLAGRRVVVILHEWRDLDWKRRLVLWPVLRLADEVLFSAPEIAAQLPGGDRRAVVPIPPNIVPPARPADSANAARLRDWGSQGRLIVAQFGSIYPRKQPLALLEIGRLLLDQGLDVGVVFVGSLVSGETALAAELDRQVAALGLENRVLVTGHVADPAELYGLFALVDAFCYLLPDGLTSRRGSVLAAALSGRPVIVNAARDPEALSHHSLYRWLLSRGVLPLAAADAGPVELARAVIDRPAPVVLAPDEIGARIDRLWDEIAAAVEGAIRGRERPEVLVERHSP